MYAQSYKTPYMTNRWCPSNFRKWICSSIFALNRHRLFLALSEECSKILSNEIKLRSGRDESWNYFKLEKLIFVLVINLFFLFAKVFVVGGVQVFKDRKTFTETRKWLFNGNAICNLLTDKESTGGAILMNNMLNASDRAIYQ